MALYLYTNISSLIAQRNANKATKNLDVSYERLASGLKINGAKDDPAGLQISDRLTNQIDHLDQGNRNAQDCISYAQTAEGAFDEITNMLQRIRTIAIQSANGTYSNTDRESLQQEVDELNEEIVRISEDTTFAGAPLLNGEAGKVIFQVGAGPNSTVTIDMRMGFDTESLAEQAAQITGSDTFTVEEGLYGSVTNSYRFTDIFNYNPDGKGIDITSQSKAQIVLAGIDALINAVDTKRAQLGAMQNRMEATIRNQESVSENVSSARATIRDTDWASETASLTQNTIFQQATASILTQANTRPQIALQLLADNG